MVGRMKPSININGETIEQVTDFTYLEYIVTDNGKCEMELIGVTKCTFSSISSSYVETYSTGIEAGSCYMLCSVV